MIIIDHRKWREVRMCCFVPFGWWNNKLTTHILIPGASLTAMGFEAVMVFLAQAESANIAGDDPWSCVPVLNMIGGILSHVGRLLLESMVQWCVEPSNNNILNEPFSPDFSSNATHVRQHANLSLPVVRWTLLLNHIKPNSIYRTMQYGLWPCHRSLRIHRWSNMVNEG